RYIEAHVLCRMKSSYDHQGLAGSDAPRSYDDFIRAFHGLYRNASMIGNHYGLTDVHSCNLLRKSAPVRNIFSLMLIWCAAREHAGLWKERFRENCRIYQ